MFTLFFLPKPHKEKAPVFQGLKVESVIPLTEVGGTIPFSERPNAGKLLQYIAGWRNQLGIQYKEHIIRNSVRANSAAGETSAIRPYRKISDYIRNNPANWQEDENSSVGQDQFYREGARYAI